MQAEGLTKRFGNFTAADQISFRIGRGEIFGLLGPNGAGKSTTFKMMCGLLRPTAGRARVAGLDLYEAAGAARARVGYMAQKFSLYGDLSVRQNLNFFAGVYGLAQAPPARADRADDRGVSTGALSRRRMPASCRWASSSAWPWPAPSCTIRQCSSSTSRLPASIRSPGASSGRTSTPWSSAASR